MPIRVPTGPGGHDRGKPELPPGSCYLCEAAAGRTEKPFVEETDLTVTLVNWNQYELGQVYIIPKRHAPTILDLTAEESASIMYAARRTADALVCAYDPEGMNLIQNNGTVAGQDAPHFHLHVVPRRIIGSNWGNGPPHIAVLEGKEPTRPKHSVRIDLETEYRIAEHIRRHLTSAPKSLK